MSSTVALVGLAAVGIYFYGKSQPVARDPRMTAYYKYNDWRKKQLADGKSGIITAMPIHHANQPVTAPKERFAAPKNHPGRSPGIWTPPAKQQPSHKLMPVYTGHMSLFERIGPKIVY